MWNVHERVSDWLRQHITLKSVAFVISVTDTLKMWRQFFISVWKTLLNFQIFADRFGWNVLSFKYRILVSASSCHQSTSPKSACRHPPSALSPSISTAHKLHLWNAWCSSSRICVLRRWAQYCSWFLCGVNNGDLGWYQIKTNYGVWNYG